MALDEPAENDMVFTEKEITFLVDKDLCNDVQPISVEYVESDMGAGFMINSSLSAKGGGCGGGCESC
jgi:Fe-S cluster assembly iron-binding protein IscA